jgi:subtilisin family serine protease
VASSGNDGPSYGTINFPGNLPEVITVGASSFDIFDVFPKSSRGPATIDRNLFIPKPNIWAPGQEIEGYNHLGKVVYKSGSSISTIIVTGYISLLFNIDNSLNTNKLVYMINESNLPLPAINFGEIISGVFNPEGLLKLTKHILNNNITIPLYILNNVIDYSMSTYSNYTMSYDNKLNNKLEFYSTMQPVEFNLLVINPNSRLHKLSLDFDINNIDKSRIKSSYCVNVNFFLLSSVYLRKTISF